MERRIAIAVLTALIIASPALAKDIYLSIAGSVGVFRTDARIFNPSGTKDIVITASFLPVGQDNTQAGTRQITVPRRQMLVLDDVVTTLFNASGLGTIRMSSPDDFVASSRIYATSVAGTLGQFVKGLEPSAAKAKGLLIQLKATGVPGQSGTYRTNIGVVNPNATTTTVTFRRFDAGNTAVGTPAIQSVPPFSVIFPITLDAAGGNFTDAWVSYEASQAVMAFASVIDNGTTDPFFIPAFEDTDTKRSIIKTSVGDLAITSVQESDRFPPDCKNPPSPGCSKSVEGFKVLVVWLESASGGVVDGFQLFDASKGVYITADDGSRTESFSAGMIDGKLFVGFTPRNTAHNFTLHWPGNPAIDLGK